MAAPTKSTVARPKASAAKKGATHARAQPRQPKTTVLPLIPPWTVTVRLGAGAFATVYRAILPESEHTRSYGWNDADSVLKVASAANLELERMFYVNFLRQRGASDQEMTYAPTAPLNTAHLYGRAGPDTYFLAMSYAGPSLQQLLQQGCTIDPSTDLLALARQMVTALQDLHQRTRHLYVDWKPDNICVDPSRTDAHGRPIFRIIDFGSVQTIFTPVGKHKPLREGVKQPGTPAYMSDHALSGISISRRDDLESLTWCLHATQQWPLPWSRQESVASEQDIISLRRESADWRSDEFLHTLLRLARTYEYAEPLDYDLLLRVIDQESARLEEPTV